MPKYIISSSTGITGNKHQTLLFVGRFGAISIAFVSAISFLSSDFLSYSFSFVSILGPLIFATLTSIK